jgi:glycosyltransferase involved in cell wall biosynthesis
MAIILNSKKGDSGNLSYELCMVELLTEFLDKEKINYMFWVKDKTIISDVEKIIGIKKKNKIKIYKKQKLRFFYIVLNHYEKIRMFINQRGMNYIEKIFQTNTFYFLSPNDLALVISTPNIISTFWDFGHKELKGYKETSSLAKRIKREYYYQQICRRSQIVVVESEQTKNKMYKYYSIRKEIIKVIGLPLPKKIEIKKDLKQTNEIGGRYFIYPAANWNHKNHVFIIEVFKEFVKINPEVKMVFCGPRIRGQVNLNKLIRKNKMQNSIIDFRYIPKENVNYLISESIALLMPTKLGPTNYPVFEANFLRTRSIISNVHELSSIKNIMETTTVINDWKIENWLSEMENAYSSKGLIKDINIRKSYNEDMIKGLVRTLRTEFWENNKH